MEVQVNTRVESLSAMLRLAEQQAASATEQAATKVEWVEAQRAEMAARERRASEAESKLKQLEWEIGERERKVEEQGQRLSAAEALHEKRQGDLTRQEDALRAELESASLRNSEAGESQRQIETKLSEVDFTRRRLDADADAVRESLRVATRSAGGLAAAARRYEVEALLASGRRLRALLGCEAVRTVPSLSVAEASERR